MENTKGKQTQAQSYEADLFEVQKVIGEELKRQGIPFFEIIFSHLAGHDLTQAIESYTSYISQ